MNLHEFLHFVRQENDGHIVKKCEFRKKKFFKLPKSDMNHNFTKN